MMAVIFVINKNMIANWSLFSPLFQWINEIRGFEFQFSRATVLQFSLLQHS